MKHSDSQAFERALEIAFKETQKRTGGLGFPILLDTFLPPWQPSIVLAMAQKVIGPSLFFTCNSGRMVPRIADITRIVLGHPWSSPTTSNESRQIEATEAEVGELFTHCIVNEFNYFPCRWKSGSESCRWVRRDGRLSPTDLSVVAGRQKLLSRFPALVRKI